MKEFTIEPEPPVNPDRIPVTEAHKRGVVDPMTGSLLRVPGTGDPVSPEACALGQSVFDGRMRYDLKLEYRRIETIKVERAIRARRWFARSRSCRSRAMCRIALPSNT